MPPVTGKSGLAATKGEIEILTNNIKFCRDEQMLLLLLLLYCSLKFIGIVKIIYFHYCFTIIVFWGGSMWRFCFSLQLATACGWCHHSSLTVSTACLGNYVARFMLILRAAAFYCYSRSGL